ncbi:MAG: hypothetical protein IJ926_00340, partial [Firmicutes bacterium]|nr:hypothetical protein [Bacillota bacterium]
AMRTDSIGRLIKRSTSEFRSLCSRVRYKAMEVGEDRMVVYDPEKRMFYMARPTRDQEEAMEYENGFVILDNTRWELPEEFELATEERDPILVFQFYPDGGASGISLSLGCKGQTVEIGVAKLTGAIVSYEKGGNQ